MIKIKNYSISILLIIFIIITKNISSKENLLIVGSQSIYPFASLVASNLSSYSSNNFKIIPSNTKDGHYFFCSGIGEKYPDIVMSSRAQNTEETKLCMDNKVNEVIEIRIGNDGIALVYSADHKFKYLDSSKLNTKISLTKNQIWQAIARDNKNSPKKWSDIDKNLPDEQILISMPPISSGTRNVFDILVMKKGCIKEMLVKNGECIMF